MPRGCRPARRGSCGSRPGGARTASPPSALAARAPAAGPARGGVRSRRGRRPRHPPSRSACRSSQMWPLECRSWGIGSRNRCERAIWPVQRSPSPSLLFRRQPGRRPRGRARTTAASAAGRSECRCCAERQTEAGRSLRVHFRVYPRTQRERPALEPVVAAEGGPGYPTIDSAESYLFMLGPLRRRHDLIVMDNRGTGRSGAINCPRLQAGKGTYSREVGRCARRLGRAANAYGTGAAADDLAAVLDKLGVPVVSIYGDSYGTYFAQAFAVRHRGSRACGGARRGVRGRGVRPVDTAGVGGPALRLAGALSANGWVRRGRPRDAATLVAPARTATARGDRPGCRRRAPPAPRRRGGPGPDSRRRTLLLHDLSGPARRAPGTRGAATAVRCCAWRRRTFPSRAADP